LVLAAAAVVCGQKTFEVQDFSKDYYGKVFIENPSEVFSKGWVAIYQKKTNRQLIKVLSESLVSDTYEGKMKANVKELPYGEQSLIMYDDFNFDGIKDFAVMDGQNSCYGGPSFRIYLAGKAKGTFTLNKSFTRLAQDYCGMFEINAKEKKISTMSKSGCCWHQFSEFIVVGNTPKAVKIVEDEMGFPYNTVSTETWNGKKMVKTMVRTIDFDENDVKILLSFKTVNNGSEVVLFSSGDQLNYAFINKTGDVSFAYPTDSGQENAGFTLDSKEKPTAHSFTNISAAYRIYEAGNEKIGVEVKTNGKLSDIPGDLNSRKGSLRQLIGENLTNVTFKQ
jgi:hypothetical protein